MAFLHLDVCNSRLDYSLSLVLPPYLEASPKYGGFT